MSFVPTDKAGLQTAVDEWCLGTTPGSYSGVTINSWDTSLVTDMSNLFNGKSTLNSNDSHVFREIRKVILDLFRHQEDFNCKIDDLTGFISKNVHIWGELVNKLPVMKFSKAQCEFLQTLEQ